MTFHEILKKEALKFAKENAIVKHGEIVTTSWGDWVKPHKVKIYEIGACLSCGKFNKRTEEFHAELDMFYYAKRLKSDGTAKPQDKDSGIALTAFIKSNGKEWKQGGQVLNHAAYHWRLPKSSNQSLTSTTESIDKIHLCDDCRNDVATCDGSPGLGCDNGGRPSDDNVVRCDKYINNGKGWKCFFCGYNGPDNRSHDTFCTFCRKHK